MSRDARQFRSLVFAVFDALQLDPQTMPLGPVHPYVAPVYPPMGRDALQKFLPDPDNERFLSDHAQGRRAFIYLKPPEKASRSLPVLNLNCDFSGSLPNVGLRLAFFLLDDDKRPVSIGFRFETPHGVDGEEGLHDYYHAQPINSFFKDSDNLLNCPPWLPCKLPAFPLQAQTPVELLSCLLLSIYGRDGIRRVMEAGRDDRVLQDSLGKFMTSMEDSRRARMRQAAAGSGAPSGKKGRRGK
ncbi:hypothetical protein [Hyalangium rubrum]|uniref:Suppressor of fused-like domain-containing protein n=1 Tax=Hyalangium rubrum TaxID=3103134 RepID=A0ABU5H7F5_9BACT|nr:hypothetical protein [Hyalangium sp. s54d21]MDY7229029.1 hypothetical protein [Hyalangium sp. s54d21]